MSNIFDESEYTDEAAESLVSAVVESTQAAEVQEANIQSTLHEVYKRIEEANLWKILIEQDAFAANSARPEILVAANTKIRDFALNQVKILMGLEKPSVAKEAAGPEIELPFEEDEINALKMISAAFLKRKPTSLYSKKQPVTPKLNNLGVQSVQEVAKPTLNTVSQSATKPASAQPAASNPAAKKAGTGAKQPRKRGGQTMPQGVKPVPVTNDGQSLMMKGALKAPPPVVTQDGRGPAISTQGLLANVINQLTGGNVVAQSQTTGDEVDINEFQ